VGRSGFHGRCVRPAEPRGSKNVFPFDQWISAQINGKNLDIPKLLSRFGIAVPFSGTSSFELRAGGTLSKPR